MVQTRSQSKKNDKNDDFSRPYLHKKVVTFSENEFNLLNNNICKKHNELKKSIVHIDTKIDNIHTKINHILYIDTKIDNIHSKVNHIVNEVHYIQQLQKNGYSLNQLYLVLILIGIGFIFFHYGKVSSYFDEIANILSTTVSQNYEDFSTYHTYVFNSTFSEDWFDKLVSHPKISTLDLDFYVNIHENNII
jgi:hypothetical protein